MLAELDTDGNGLIDYNEFITAAIDQRKVSEEMMRAAFNILDYD